MTQSIKIDLNKEYVSHHKILIALSAIIGITSFAPVGSNIVGTMKDTLTPYNGPLNSLFESNSSPGVIAICKAEGNCKSDGSKTSLYSGHTDPGNGVTNRGWCSDQGRGGTNLENADRGCLERTQQRITRITRLMKEAGVEPEQNLEAFVNAVDQWNQASPRVSDNFPSTYKKAIAQGKKGLEAINWARVEAFRKNSGELEAGDPHVGLFHICASPNNNYYRDKLRPYQAWSEHWKWNCIYLDQSRRSNEISQVLSRQSEKTSVHSNPSTTVAFICPAKGILSQGFNIHKHIGIDIAGTTGDSIVAAAAGQVVKAGWDDWGLGNAIRIRHANGETTVYGHNSRLLVNTGQQVSQGQAIAQMGNTGHSSGPHLHFETHQIDKTPYDPSKYC